jgi:hypothetical protein
MHVDTIELAYVGCHLMPIMHGNYDMCCNQVVIIHAEIMLNEWHAIIRNYQNQTFFSVHHLQQ